MLLTPQTTLAPQTYADPTLQLAMQELLGFLRQSPGAHVGGEGDVAVEFSVRDVPGYSVHVSGSKLVFVGPSPVEILYAVYTFAEERLGFCFVEFGRDRLRRREHVELGEGVVVDERAPLLRNRGFIQEYPPDESNFALADWMARNRLNYLLTWMKHYDHFTPELKEHCRVRGIQIESGHHNFEYFIPLEKYGPEHPEFFAVKGGQRVRAEAGDRELMLSKQLCVSNPELRAEFAKNMLAYADAHPEVSALSVIPNDGFGWCECEECSRLYDRTKRGEFFCVSEHVAPAQALYHDFVRDVAARVHAQRPDLTITLAAYINYLEPAEGFRLADGLAVHVAAYWRCVNHLVSDPACPFNRRYLRAIAQWGEAKDGGTMNIYEYYMGVNAYVSLPMVHHRAVFEEARAWAGVGADGLLTQFHPPHWTAYGLNYWAMAKAAYGEGEEAVDRAMQSLFGPDAAEAEEFYAALRDLCLSAGRCLVPIPRPLLLRTRMDAYQGLRRRALALLEKDPPDRFRRNLATWTEYLVRFKDLYDRYQSGEDVRPGLQEFCDWAEARQQEGSELCVLSRLKKRLEIWAGHIAQGRPWYHSNLDWENEYVRRYDELLDEDW